MYSKHFWVRNLAQGPTEHVLSHYLPTTQFFGLQLGLEPETLQIPAQAHSDTSKPLYRVTRTHQSKRLWSCEFIPVALKTPSTQNKSRFTLYQLTSAHFCCRQLTLPTQNYCNPPPTCSSVKSRSSWSDSIYHIQIFHYSFQSINTAATFLYSPSLYDSVTRGPNCWRLIITKDSSWWFIKKKTKLFVHFVIKEQHQASLQHQLIMQKHEEVHSDGFYRCNIGALMTPRRWFFMQKQHKCSLDITPKSCCCCC